MRILLFSHLFAPRIGGIETMSKILAQNFAAHGHEVRVITTTPDESSSGDCLGMPVIRNPSARALAREVSWCDLCFHNNISLTYAWPILISRRPWVVTTQTWIARHDGNLGWREHLKRLLLKRAHSVAISQAIAETLPVSSEIIPNCYDSTTFYEVNNPLPHRPLDLIFVGRLVSDKGVDLALDALKMLAKQNLRPTLTVVGEGPEISNLESQVTRLGLNDQVNFVGSIQGAALAREFHQHRIQLVPSRWAEPFGIVALEGAACGCLVLGSQNGGLSDAIGPCGETFPNGNATALANLIAQALRGDMVIPSRVERQKHLRKHQPESVTKAYLALFDHIAPIAS